MTDRRALVPRRPAAPSLPDLPQGNAWFGSETTIARKNTAFVEQHTAYLRARAAQSNAMSALVDSRVALAERLADLHNVLHELQERRDHERWLADCRRDRERTQARYDHQLLVIRNEAELAKAREAIVRAQRNLEAAERVKAAQIDEWYAKADAQRNNALAERQDTAADLAHTPPPSAAGSQLPELLAILDHQIELEKQRGNSAAALALANLRARLRAA